jgi:diguanylate cyclase (GGDEF)-like protein
MGLSIMKLDTKVLHSKVARRIFVLFVLCALLPALTLSIVSYSLVVKQLNNQMQERLHQSSKDTALGLLERLLFLEAQMKIVAFKIRSGAGLSSGEVREVFNTYFNGMTVLTEKGRPAVLFGSDQTPPKLTPQQNDHIRAGKTLVSIRNGSKIPLPVFMSRILDPQHPERGNLFAEVNPAYLWGNPEYSTGQPLFHVYLQDQSGMRPIFSPPGLSILPEPTASSMAQSFSGDFEWADKEKKYTSSYWTVFLGNNFFVPKWTVVVSESRADLLMPMFHFKKMFSLIFLMSLWVVLLLSISQIRRNLGPIEKLKDATRRISDRDFDAQVAVKSGDEFEELAASFNTMTGRLGRQFKALTGMAKIDRAILSALDTKHIVEAVLIGMKEIVFCDCVAVTLLETKQGRTPRTYIRCGNSETEESQKIDDILPADLQRLRESSEPIVIESGQDIPSYLGPLAERGMQSFLVLPVFLKADLAAVIALGHSQPPRYDPDDLLHIRQLADQVAVALSNARMVEQIHVLAYYDGLTGLPNRVLFKEQLAQLLKFAKRHNHLVAILFLDLDNFKRINDTLGHDLGDKLLRDVTDRLTQWIRPSDYASRANIENTVVSRLGGDEFTLYLAEIAQVQDAARVAQRILDVLSKPFMLDTHEVFITASVGITIFPLDGEDGETLLKNADTAMYHAKNRGRNNYQFFAASMNATIMERLTLEIDLRKSLEREELLLYYQPQLDLHTGRIIGMEALIRWMHPNRGMVLPSEFISLSEESGMIVPIGQWVMRTACAQNKALQAAGLLPVRVAANLSGRQILDPQLPEMVAQILKDTGLSPEYLELELTESMLMKKEETILNTMHELKEMGIRLLIDDFGTGYSSLSYLKSFPLDTLKIDKSFVDHIPTNPDDVALVRAIIAMAHSLKLRVLAEGVELEEQLEFLREEGCDEIQGYLISRPVPADALEKFLLQEKHLASNKFSHRSRNS